MTDIKTTKTAYIIFNTKLRQFRSSRTGGGYQEKFSKAVLYTMKHHAKNAAKRDDVIIPVDMKLDPEEMFVAILKG